MAAVSADNQLEFEVEGSSGEIYTVTFKQKGANLNAYCTCPAGENNIHCKHRIALMGGDDSNLLSENTADIMRLKTILQGTELESAYKRMHEATNKLDTAKRELASAKKVLTRAMYR